MAEVRGSSPLGSTPESPAKGEKRKGLRRATGAQVPVIGGIILLIFMVLDSEPGTNEYGPNPKEGSYSLVT